MICSTSFFTSITAKISQTVKLPNGEIAAVTHVGTVQVTANILLYNVLCVPSFSFNLLSACKLAHELNCCLIFLSTSCFIRGLSPWTTIGKGSMEHGLYHLLHDPVSPQDLTNTLSQNFHSQNYFSASVQPTDNSHDLWHYRLGHPSPDRMHLISDAHVLKQMNKTNILPCLVCPLAKQTRSPFPSSSHTTTSCFEIIHCDLWGPHSIIAHDGSKFFLTIVDDYSRCTWVYLLKQKSDARSYLKSFCHLVQNQFNTSVKILCSDNGPEFFMTDFYSDQGIIHQKSCVETPQQNGLVERKHRHLLQVARALRFQSQIPLRFWSDCVLTATYLINRIPTPLLQNKTPYELLFHKPPSFSHLRVFGCLAFASTISQHRHKFDPRSRRCAFLGYPFDVKGYKLLNLDTHQIFISRDVIFHETLFPFHTPSLLSTPNVAPNPPLPPTFSLPDPDSTCNIPHLQNSTKPNPISYQHLQFFPIEPPPAPTLRCSTRTRNTPTHLNNYICPSLLHSPPLQTMDSSHLQVTHAPTEPSSSLSVAPCQPGKAFPLSSTLSFHKLSPSYFSFVSAISSSLEPSSYGEALKILTGVRPCDLK